MKKIKLHALCLFVLVGILGNNSFADFNPILEKMFKAPTKRLDPGELYFCDVVLSPEDKMELKNREGRYFFSATIAHSNFSNVSLIGANLYFSTIYNSNFEKAKLIGADLSLSDLSLSNFRDADLSNSNLSWTNFYGADIRGANFEGADLTGAYCQNKFSEKEDRYEKCKYFDELIRNGTVAKKVTLVGSIRHKINPLIDSDKKLESEDSPKEGTTRAPDSSRQKIVRENSGCGAIPKVNRKRSVFNLFADPNIEQNSPRTREK